MTRIRSSIRRLTPVIAALSVAVSAGCVSQSVRKVDAVKAVHAERDLPAGQLLDVAVITFDPGIPDTAEEQKQQNISPDVRKAEAVYIPYVLRQTLQNTDYWGAVRVLPEASPGHDLTITGKILQSDGQTLKLRIQATDASGRQWFDRTYEDTAAALAYSEKLPPGVDPFQNLYNRIANDLLAQRRSLDAAQLAQIKRVADLRFAADMAPQRFDQYLHQDRHGVYSVDRLPPADDPMQARVDAIRARDDLLVDTIDQYYGVFQNTMQPKYLAWRKSSYEEVAALQELHRSELWRKIVGGLLVAGGAVALSQSGGTPNAGAAGVVGIAGGAYLFKTGMDKAQEEKVHVESLRELNVSLGADMKPRVVELEGKTVTLTGSAQEQYRQWRRLLHDMYADETGASDSAGSPAKTPQ
ncbi:MAG: hypothetical protein KGJ55_03265 [Gammaproteobacteria bacterium]|nr:hypothetical protein [Gammaproteobacteria bacterium]